MSDAQSQRDKTPQEQLVGVSATPTTHAEDSHVAERPNVDSWTSQSLHHLVSAARLSAGRAGDLRGGESS